MNDELDDTGVNIRFWFVVIVLLIVVLSRLLP